MGGSWVDTWEPQHLPGGVFTHPAGVLLTRAALPRLLWLIATSFPLALINQMDYINIVHMGHIFKWERMEK
jgi:hypothetical protein